MEDKESPRDLEELIKGCAEKHGKKLNRQQLKSYVDSFLRLANILGDDEIPVDAVKLTLAEKVNAVEYYAQSARSRLDHDFSNTKERLNKQDERIKEMERRISAAEDHRIPISDQRAKDLLALQVALLDNYSHFGADANVAARCTSYGLWAYLQSSNGTTITPMPAEEVEQ